jgi:hypothetical protein
MCAVASGCAARQIPSHCTCAYLVESKHNGPTSIREGWLVADERSGFGLKEPVMSLHWNGPPDEDAKAESSHGLATPCYACSRDMDNPIVCRQKRELLAQIAQLLRESVTIAHAEVEAILTGQPIVDFERRLDTARERRKLLLERLEHHITEHGC